MNEKVYIIQQIRRKAYIRKHCMEVLGFSSKAWKKYCKHAENGKLPQAIGHPPRITPGNGALAAKSMRENQENDKSALVTPHEGGVDVTLADLLRDAADRSNPKKTGKRLDKKTVAK